MKNNVVLKLAVTAGMATLLNACSTNTAIQKQLAEMQTRIDAARLQATRAQDVLDIMNLQARYEAIHSTQESLVWSLYAPREDSIDEVTHSKIIGFEYIKMQFEDREKLQQLYADGKLPKGTHLNQMSMPAPAADGKQPAMMGPPGAGNVVCKGNPNAKSFGSGSTTVPPIHPIATYNIVVADDGQTAKATFTSLGYERCGWSYGKYANDYIKIDGVWYIWHKKWLRGFSAPYYTSPDELTVDQIFEWTKERDEKGFPVVNKNLHTDYLWYPGKEDMTIVAPKPYKTWTDAEMYWWEGEAVAP